VGHKATSKSYQASHVGWRGILGPFSGIFSPTEGINEQADGRVGVAMNTSVVYMPLHKKQGQPLSSRRFPAIILLPHHL